MRRRLLKAGGRRIPFKPDHLRHVHCRRCRSRTSCLSSSAAVSNPGTHYAEVEELLRQFLEGVRGALGGQFVGAYLFGSLACGGFDRASDVDVLVVTEGEISDALFSSLQATHERVAASGSHRATQLE